MPGRPSSHTRTQVVVVGGGPAGLMLSHLLARSGIDSVVLDTRSAEEIENTHRAGILERDSVRLLVESGASDRVLRDGHELPRVGPGAVEGDRHPVLFREYPYAWFGVLVQAPASAPS